MGMSPEAIERAQKAAEAAGATLMAQAGAAANTYQAALTEFQMEKGGAGVPLGPLLGPGGSLTKKSGILDVSASGKVMYDNGAIYDPATGQTLYPPNPTLAAGIPGSEAWIQDIQDRWSEEKADEWRKKLWDQGYQAAGLQAETGGWGHDLLAALRAYHNNRYANNGKVQPLAPGAGDIGTREAIRKQTDFKALVNEAKSWGDAIELDLSDDEAESLADRLMRKRFVLAREHPEWTMDQIASGASMRVQEEFVDAPGVKGAIRDAEEDELDDSLLNDVVSISQLGAV